jgi:hypothetical protein
MITHEIGFMSVAFQDMPTYNYMISDKYRISWNTRPCAYCFQLCHYPGAYSRQAPI